ncbi:MAG TPA: alpha/beta fold hydrolase [Desulfosporosinus sp.]|nr:alpha/beta fold hydrolase [Desulfosporosinus sp.]
MKPQRRSVEPFYFPGKRVGCLLIHGFSGAPAEMRFMGERLAEAGWTVLGILLSGHGTTPEQRAETSWEDWAKDVEVGVKELRKSCDTVIGIGLSMGGLLALHLATLGLVDGIVAMNAPMVAGENLPVDALISLDRAINQVGRKLDMVKCPALLMQSMKDRTVNPISVNIIENKIQQVRPTVILWGKSGHILTLGAEREEIVLRVQDFLRQFQV